MNVQDIACQPSTSGKRGRSKSCSEDDFDQKRLRIGSVNGIGMLSKARIYNCGVRKKPAELFRKDLISAMKMADSEQLNSEDYLPITDPWREEWEKGVQVPVNPDVLLRQTSVKQVQKSPSKKSPSKKTDRDPLKMTKKILKFDPERDSLAARYEIDLTDKCWLESIFCEEEALSLSEDMFEEIMNELEYQSARNMKAKHVGIEYDDHIICDVCRSPDAEDGNEMVFCDSCDICVHQACYGITVIPDGEWRCRPCKSGKVQSQKSVSCELCPNPGGAFKPTSNGKWAHVSCALWVPEVSIGCVSTMEPITKIKQIPSSRWNLMCNICNIKQGTPIQCSIKTCKAAYHVTCAFRSKLRMRALVEPNEKGIKLKSYCQKHSEQDEKTCTDDSSQKEFELTDSNQTDSDKNNRFWMYIDSSELNQSLTSKLLNIHSDYSQTTIQFIIDLVYQYWKIKRTSNAGLPLIRVVTADTIEELQKERRNDILRLRVNLERIRNLSYMICRREKQKRLWIRSQQEIVEKSISVLTGVIIPHNETPENGHPTPTITAIADQDKIMLIRDVCNTDNIYNEKDETYDLKTLKTKRLQREINKLLHAERVRKTKPNPYAKLYIKPVTKRTTSESTSSESITCDIKEEPIVEEVKNSKMPLKNKCVPANVQKPEPKVKDSSFGFADKIIKNSPMKNSPIKNLKVQKQNKLDKTEKKNLRNPVEANSNHVRDKQQVGDIDLPDVKKKRFQLRNVAGRSQHFYSIKDAAIRAANGIDITRQKGLQLWLQRTL